MLLARRVMSRGACLRCEPLPPLSPSRGERAASRAHRLTNAVARSPRPAHRTSYRLGLAPSPVERRTTHYGDCGSCCLLAGQSATRSGGGWRSGSDIERLGGRTVGVAGRPYRGEGVRATLPGLRAVLASAFHRSGRLVCCRPGIPPGIGRRSRSVLRRARVGGLERHDRRHVEGSGRPRLTGRAGVNGRCGVWFSSTAAGRPGG